MSDQYWRDDHSAPWATLLRVVDTYCHPERADDAYERLQHLAKHADTERMRAFKQELRDAIRDPARIPEGALSRAADYDDGSDIKFLTRLWRDLYPDEPIPFDPR